MTVLNGPPFRKFSADKRAMPDEKRPAIYYKRARFRTNLPADLLYSKSHYWLAQDAPGTYRIGLTKFATRMLGDFVELKLDVAHGDQVQPGQPIGTIEGFKAVSDIYCVAAGCFAGGNSALETEPTLLDRQPYDAGWLYRLEMCRPEAELDVHDYIKLLDATIDRMLQQQQDQKDKSC